MIFVCLAMLVPSAFAAELLSCEWGGSYLSNELLFFANNDFTNIMGSSSGTVLSSPIAFSEDTHYDLPLSCNSPLSEPGDELTFYESEDPTCSGDEVLLHFTGETNALASLEYNSSKHEYSLCAKLPTSISAVDIVISQDKNYEDIGYTCLFRTSNNDSGRISSCDAEFNSGQTYDYTVWARAFQSTASLSCNLDCSSNIDNRVRVGCAQKVDSCQRVPSVCDGSLLNSWVKYNDSHQIKCSKPWDEFRENPLDSGSNIQVETNELDCPNVISQDYSVILDNEPVKMKVYVCSD